MVGAIDHGDEDLSLLAVHVQVDDSAVTAGSSSLVLFESGFLFEYSNDGANLVILVLQILDLLFDKLRHGGMLELLNIFLAEKHRELWELSR